MNLSDLEIFGIQLIDVSNTLALIFRFILNLLVTWSVIHFFYYKKSKKWNYYFTFVLISITIFLLIYLLDSVKLQMGMALGLFAIFGIIRYRTETVPIREMTYLFTLIAISVINGLTVNVSLGELLITNLLFITVISVLELDRFSSRTQTKLILYEKIDLIKPENKELLYEDLRQRTGLNIYRIEVGHIDFLRDAAFLKVSYRVGPNDTISSIENVTKISQYEE